MKRITRWAAALFAALMLAGCAAQQKLPELKVAIPEGGEHLAVECTPYAPLEDNGTRTVTVNRSIFYQFLDGTIREDEETFDLSGDRSAEEWPEIRLWNHSSLFGNLSSPVSDPVDGAADRAYLLDLVESAEYVVRDDDTAYEDQCIYVYVTESDGTENCYAVFSDGTIARGDPWESKVTEYAYGAADYLRVQALAYKYSADPYNVGAAECDEWLASYRTNQWDAEAIGSADSYCLCLQTGDFHVDLDRAQALALLENLFGAGELNYNLYEGPLPPAYKPAPWDWTPPENGVMLTEYLSGEFMTERTEKESEGFSQTVYLYPDGSVALVPNRLLWRWYQIFQDIPGAEENQPIQAIEEVRPSWQRVCLAEDAFSWPMLQACLEALKG